MKKKSEDQTSHSAHENDNLNETTEGQSQEHQTPGENQSEEQKVKSRRKQTKAELHSLEVQPFTARVELYRERQLQREKLLKKAKQEAQKKKGK